MSLGPWSTLLLVGSLHGLAVAALLLRAPANRIANRCLAALMGVVVLLVTPYTIGYAGAYDAYPWLTFAPFFWELAIGPLLWLYVRQLAVPDLPSRWGWHFLPAALQGLYYLVLFTWPLQAKWDWSDQVHEPWVVPVETLLVHASMAVYFVLALRAFRGYQAWLEQHSGAREEWRLPWLRGFLVAMGAVILMRLAHTVLQLAWRPLDYFDEFPMYVGFVAVLYYLGIEGWRHARDPYPAWRPDPPPLPASDLDEPDAPAASSLERPATVPASGKDWAALGQKVAGQVQAAQWWREPDLSLPELARRVGTNTHYLSRAINEGLGQSFSDFINRFRVAEAQQRLQGDEDILAIAMAVGFGSKASFNRVFRAMAGESPSAFRQRQGLKS
ncbi:helix-turn-helix domain-containing protein [Arenimonas sp. MALMAid1274]|uniref:helix-turn-helix domain-containing protein n=1 Tax=Arenimonas sp. MALMAid1274 TaxID=3411630 RepID=UPI003BA0868C